MHNIFFYVINNQIFIMV